MTLEKKLGDDSSVGCKNTEDRTKWLEDIFKKYFAPGYSYFGHATGSSYVEKILEEGLNSYDRYIDGTLFPLNGIPGTNDSHAEIEKSINSILKFPHRGFKRIVIVAIPNPTDKEHAGLHYFNSVFEELEDNKKIDVGIQGTDISYKIPNEFLVGYIDVKNKCFVENPGYDPNAKVVFKPIKERTIGSGGKHKYDPEKSGPVIPPEKYTDLEIF